MRFTLFAKIFKYKVHLKNIRIVHKYFGFFIHLNHVRLAAIEDYHNLARYLVLNELYAEFPII